MLYAFKEMPIVLQETFLSCLSDEDKPNERKKNCLSGAGNVNENGALQSNCGQAVTATLK